LAENLPKDAAFFTNNALLENHRLIHPMKTLLALARLADLGMEIQKNRLVDEPHEKRRVL
jgi:hypothetical protein